jgi:hypothetical protein
LRLKSLETIARPLLTCVGIVVGGVLFFGIAYGTLTIFTGATDPHHASMIIFVVTIIGCILGIAFGAMLGAEWTAKLHGDK